MLSSIEASSDILPQPDTKNWHFEVTILVAIILNASKVPLSDSRWQLHVSPSIPCFPPRWNYTMRWTEAACRGRPRIPGPCPGTAPPGSRAGTSRRSGRVRRSRYAGTFSTESERAGLFNCQESGVMTLSEETLLASRPRRHGDVWWLTVTCWVSPLSSPAITCAGIRFSTARPDPASKPQHTSLNTQLIPKQISASLK